MDDVSPQVIRSIYSVTNVADEFDNITDKKRLRSLLPKIQNGEGPSFFNVKVRAENLPLVLPPKDGAFLKDRFRVALFGSDAVR